MTALPTRKKLLFALLSALAAIVILTGAAEIALRFRYEKIERITGAAEWQPGQWESLTYHWDRYHPRLGWTNLTGYRSDERIPFTVTINDQGLRAGRSYASHPPTGVRRIAVFGDSATFGEEVDDDQTVPHYLEQALVSVEVLNFGVRGYGLGQMLLRLEEEGFQYHPDLVLFVVLVPADIGRVIADRLGHPKPVFRVEGQELIVGNLPVPEASRQSWLQRSSFAAAWLWGRPRDWTEVETLDENLRITSAILHRLRSACEAHRTTCMLVPIVTAGTLDRMRIDEDKRGRVDHMCASLADAGLETLDAVDYLERVLEREEDALVAPHGHWSARGNRLLAEWIAHQLTLRFPQPDQ